MTIDDYLESNKTQQKQTHVTFDNPDHEKTTISHTDEETAKKHFRAANAIQNSRVNRRVIVGDFLVALDEEMSNEDSDAIEEFFEKLME